MGVRGRQVFFVGIGVVCAIVMGMLGVWQMQRSVDSGAAGIRQRAEQAPVALLENINVDGTVGDVYGKPVTVSGSYLLGQELLVPGSDGSWRVLTAFQVADGRVVPIVRGSVSDTNGVPSPPTGPRPETGLFLPGAGHADGPGSGQVGSGQIGSVRMPLLAQKWPQQLTPGFVTLDAEHARAQRLVPASVTLPKGEKSFNNGSYAIQWWLFAAFALGMGIKLAADAGRRERRRLESDALAATATVAATSPSAERGAQGEDD